MTQHHIAVSLWAAQSPSRLHTCDFVFKLRHPKSVQRFARSRGFAPGSQNRMCRKPSLCRLWLCLAFRQIFWPIRKLGKHTQTFQNGTANVLKNFRTCEQKNCFVSIAFVSGGQFAFSSSKGSLTLRPSGQRSGNSLRSKYFLNS